MEARIHAEPASPPARRDWTEVSAASDEYRRVRLSGEYLNARETLVQAVTERGPGYWVMTPLLTRTDGIILVNRGFVPADRSNAESRLAGQISQPTTVTGLLRMSEPHGGFLRSNDPAGNRWYSRDVAAIAAARDLADVAPYFVDADATPNDGGLPIGGLTVIAFRNNHLVYALTWYALALMLVAFATYRLRERLNGIK